MPADFLDGFPPARGGSTRWRPRDVSALLLLACAFMGGSVAAQEPSKDAAPTAETAETVAPLADTPPAQPADAPKPEPTSTSTSSDDEDEAGGAQVAPEPAPPDSHAQRPAPYLERPARPTPFRGIEFGAHVGVVHRDADGTSARYDAGPAFGGYFTLPLLSWRRVPALRPFFMGLRVQAGAEYHAVDVVGDLGVPDAEFTQPEIGGVNLVSQLEPGVQFYDWLSVYAGVGIGWGRLEAAPLVSSGAARVVTARRAGVFVEVPLSLGVQLEVVPQWVNVNLSASVNLLPVTSGSLFEPSQAISGTAVTVEAFPEFGTSVAGRLSVGIIL